ncbi:MAG: methyltransferase domain-containing protein [Bradymonadales bacterium]|nr:methyltransferase domain-containing protein [Bradymonadales bacterium]
MTTGEEKNYGDTFSPAMVAMIEDGPHRILEVGCAQGFQLAHLKGIGKASFTVGVERVATAAELARKRVDRVLCGDVEELELTEYLGFFDYILYGDVLEHLVQPWTLVERQLRLLSGGGRMVISLPNVRNLVLIAALIRGDWSYTRFGLLDDTHLRFFTRSSILEAFQKLHLVVEREDAIRHDESFYRATMGDHGPDEEVLAAFQSIRQQWVDGQDCSRELADLLGHHPFAPQDVSDLLTVQHLFLVRAGTAQPGLQDVPTT